MFVSRSETKLVTTLRGVLEDHLLSKRLVAESASDTEPFFVDFLASLDGHRGVDIRACFEAWLKTRA